MTNIAILMTCYNRKETTLSSIKALYKQDLPSNNIHFKVFLVDDGSTDGTSSEVQKLYPETVLLYGNGELFWCGGTRLAFKEALKESFDFFLWLNDDTILKERAIKSLIHTYNLLQDKVGPEIIVVGSMEDSKSGNITYGGVVRHSRARPLKFNLIKPHQTNPLKCHTMNGNLVLIHHSVVKKIGNITEGFVHGMGDFDYGLKANKAGVQIYIAPNTLGYCSRNGIKGTPDDESLSLAIRIRKFISIKHMPPKQWKIYSKIHGGRFWFVYMISPYIMFLLRLIKNKIKYKTHVHSN